MADRPMSDAERNDSAARSTIGPGAVPPEASPRAARGGGKACPHCGAPLIEHADSEPGSPKYGAWHCNTCGCCLVGDPLEQREGHPICGFALARTTAAAPR